MTRVHPSHREDPVQRGVRPELGGPAYSILKGELSNLTVEQLWFLGQQIIEFHSNGLSQVWFIHHSTEGL